MSDDEAKPDLSFVTADELIEELAKRHEGLVVCWETNLNTKQTEFFCEWRGPLTLAIGLAERSRARLVQIALDRPSEELNQSPEDET